MSTHDNGQNGWAQALAVTLGALALAAARHMDSGGKVEARVSKLRQHRNPWQRIEFEVFVKF